MPVNPHQRKEISIVKLEKLRKDLREAYFRSNGEELQQSNNKENPYYKSLIDDILEKTDKSLSKGTIHKLFYDDKKRIYQIIIIETIKKYIGIVMEDNTQVKHSDNTESKISGVQNDPEVKMFAKKIYIELITRKAAIPIDEDNDVIEEIYNSWYKLFCVIRDEMKTMPISYYNDQVSQPLIIQTMKILNDTLRPHLTEHQAKYRNWLEKAKCNPKNKNISPQELQKKYPNYEVLMKSIKQVNKTLIDGAEKINNFSK